MSFGSNGRHDGRQSLPIGPGKGHGAAAALFVRGAGHGDQSMQLARCNSVEARKAPPRSETPPIFVAAKDSAA